MKIYNADFRDVLPGLADNTVELLLTDIPYGAVNNNATGGGGKRKINKGEADVCDFPLNDMVKQVVRVCSGSFYVFCGTEQVSELRRAFVKAGVRTRLCIWEKTNPSPFNGEYMWLSSIECCVFARKSGACFHEFCKSPVWRYPTQKSIIHPTQKPVGLFEYLVKTSSERDDTVLDICMGSGTTGVAAINEGRHFIGIERSPRYFELAKQRLERVYSSPRQDDLGWCQTTPRKAATQVDESGSLC